MHLREMYARVVYLTDGNVVSRLLEARCVVVSISNNNANLVQNHRPDQLVGALNLNHDGLDV